MPSRTGFGLGWGVVGAWVGRSEGGGASGLHVHVDPQLLWLTWPGTPVIAIRHKKRSWLSGVIKKPRPLSPTLEGVLAQALWLRRHWMSCLLRVKYRSSHPATWLLVCPWSSVLSQGCVQLPPGLEGGLRLILDQQSLFFSLNRVRKYLL